MGLQSATEIMTASHIKTQTDDCNVPAGRPFNILYESCISCSASYISCSIVRKNSSSQLSSRLAAPLYPTSGSIASVECERKRSRLGSGQMPNKEPDAPAAITHRCFDCQRQVMLEFIQHAKDSYLPCPIPLPSYSAIRLRLPLASHLRVATGAQVRPAPCATPLQDPPPGRSGHPCPETVNRCPRLARARALHGTLPSFSVALNGEWPPYQELKAAAAGLKRSACEQVRRVGELRKLHRTIIDDAMTCDYMYHNGRGVVCRGI